MLRAHSAISSVSIAQTSIQIILSVLQTVSVKVLRNILVMAPSKKSVVGICSVVVSSLPIFIYNETFIIQFVCGVKSLLIFTISKITC